MKKLSLSIVACLALGTFAMAGGDIAPVYTPVEEVVAPAPEKSGFYVGAGVSFLSWEEKANTGEVGDVMLAYNDLEATWTGGTILAGYQFNPYIAVEGRYAMSFTDASWEANGGYDWDDGSDLSNLAIYLKPMYPIGDFALYGLLGYGQTSIEYEGGGDYDDSGFQWGIGAGYNFTESLGAFVDYTVWYDDDSFDDSPAYMSDFKADAITVGITYKF
ncbi:MAG TPA: porin family protein [Epsilonproteobacteria bacterium]|nr:porin family protein [Campylobacterota bacterium]